MITTWSMILVAITFISYLLFQFSEWHGRRGEDSSAKLFHVFHIFFFVVFIVVLFEELHRRQLREVQRSRRLQVLKEYRVIHLL